MAGRGFDATDPRDEVYSVLGLGRMPVKGAAQTAATPKAQDGREAMVVGYSKSVSEVYQYVAKFFIKRDKNLDILCILLTH
jgi:hypothetical protein